MTAGEIWAPVLITLINMTAMALIMWIKAHYDYHETTVTNARQPDSTAHG